MASRAGRLVLGGLVVLAGALSMAIAWLFSFPWEEGLGTRLAHLILVLTISYVGLVFVSVASDSLGSPRRQRRRYARVGGTLTVRHGLVCRAAPIARSFGTPYSRN